MNWRDLIGVPFIDKGRNPNIGLDCWGMTIAARKCFGFETPDYAISCFASHLIDRAAAEGFLNQWEKLEHPEPGCALALRIDPEFPDMIQHFGVFVGKRRFIHTSEKTGAITTRIDDRFFGRKIVGYYRHHKDHQGQ